MFEVKKNTNSNKTIRMPDELIEQLQSLADKNDISFNQLVVQCCEYALKHINKFLFIELIQKNQHRICKYKRLIGPFPNSFCYNISVDIIQVVFRLCRSDIIAFSAIVLLKPCGFSVILFAKLGVAEYHDAKHHITAKQYHSPNIFGE